MQALSAVPFRSHDTRRVHTTTQSFLATPVSGTVHNISRDHCTAFILVIRAQAFYARGAAQWPVMTHCWFPAVHTRSPFFAEVPRGTNRATMARAAGKYEGFQEEGGAEWKISQAGAYKFICGSTSLCKA